MEGEETVTPAVEGAEVEETAEATAAEEIEEIEEVETPDDDSSADSRKKSGVSKRIDELVKQREDERRRAERLESMLEQMLAKQEAPEPPKSPAFQPTRPKPTLESCEYDPERHIEELTDWKIEQREAQRRLEEAQRNQQSQQQTQARTFAEKRDLTIQQGSEKFPDFQEAVFSLPGDVLHERLAMAIFETAAPADVAYYLGKNPQEAARIAKLDPVRMALELGRMESKAIVPPPKKKTTAAPPPITPVGQAAAANAEPDAAKDPEGWLAWERARVKALGRRY